MSTPDMQGPSVVYESEDSEPVHEEPHKELDSNISNDPNISTDAADQPGKEINDTTFKTQQTSHFQSNTKAPQCFQRRHLNQHLLFYHYS